MTKEDRIKQKIQELSEIFEYNLDDYYCDVIFTLKDLDLIEGQEEIYRQVIEDLLDN